MNDFLVADYMHSSSTLCIHFIVANIKLKLVLFKYVYILSTINIVNHQSDSVGF